jgi:CubicO group peptidase (beta-lactamase class C family)
MSIRGRSPGIYPVLLVLTMAMACCLEAASFKPEVLAEMDREIAAAIGDKKCPGGVLWLERGADAYRRSYGNRSVTPSVEPMTEDTIFDAASLTKVLACTPAVMLLVERGAIDLSAPVRRYLPEFPQEPAGFSPVTVRHLITHTSGLRPGISSRGDWQGLQGALGQVSQEKLQAEPGSTFRYSDINFIVLGALVERVSGMPLNEFVQREIYAPLGMKDSGYLPPAQKTPRIAPTEVVNGSPLRGVVHDPTARKMGGVAGHAGLFTTAADISRFARMLLNLGELEGKRIFKPETVRLMTSVQTPENLSTRRGLGWDIDSSYSGPRGKLFPLGSFGHTGWTGTSLWIDPFSRTFVIFLSNRNHPTEAGSVIALRSKLGTLAAQAVPDFDFENVSGALAPRPRAETSTPVKPVLNGIDVLVRDKFAPLKGLKIALITNHTGEDRERRSTIDLLHNAPEVNLRFLYGPEHGIRGNLDEKISDSIDEKTGLRVVSLYGENRKPKPEQLSEIDAIVFDIQDIGCRFYTYPSTMGLAIEAAAQNNKKIFVLDRVNPINGTTIEGPVLDAKPTFVGFTRCRFDTA